MTTRADISDEALMVRYQRGDKGAFTALVRRHQMALYNFAFRQLRITSLAEDVVQEAFIRVVQNALEFKHEARFSTWVYSITRNLCIDQLRKRALRRHPSLEDSRTGQEGEPTLAEQTADTKVSVERSAQGSELKQRIVEALDFLSDDQREVFLLREISGLPFKEIADIVGCTENTVKSRMRYALLRLREELEEYEEYSRALR